MSLIIWYHASVMFFLSDYEVVGHLLFKILCIFRWILNKQADQDDHLFKKKIKSWRKGGEPLLSLVQLPVQIFNGA